MITIMSTVMTMVNVETLVKQPKKSGVPKSLRTFVIPIAIVILVSFALGITWGLKLRHDREIAIGVAKPSSVLRILTFKNLLRSELIAGYENRSSTKIELTEVGTPEELWERLESTAAKDGYDLISLYSYQIPLAMQMGRIQPIDVSQIKNLDIVSPDFRHLPGDPSLAQAVPILWGLTGLIYNSSQIKDPDTVQSWLEILKNRDFSGKVGLLSSTIDLLRLADLMHASSETSPSSFAMSAGSASVTVQKLLQPILSLPFVVLASDYLSGSSLLAGTNPPSVMQINHGETAFLPATSQTSSAWKFVVPVEGATLWTLDLALTRDAHSVREASSFLDYLLEPGPATQLVNAFHQASTNRELNKSGIDNRLKPSYLRQMPLSQMTVWQDFSRARETRALLKARQ